MISFFYLGLYKYKGILLFKKNVPIYIERVVKILQQQGLVRDKIYELCSKKVRKW